MKNLIESGITIHHAGMLRPERSLAENLFKEGVARILVCTATLAWGVNLPSRYVIIKGTSIWDSGSGGFKDIDLLDILQIFGRAGRPQFDTIGKATLITSRDRLDYFLRLMTSQIPIESRFNTHLADALNAEIAMGNITSVHEAVAWLRYTYMYVRFFKAPQKYGINVSDLSSDPLLEQFRTDLVNAAAETLNSAHLIRISRTAGSLFASTDLGRVAAHFYVRWDTAEMFASKIRPDMTDAEIAELVGCAHEFSQLKCREEEMEELESVSVDKTICPITKLRGGGLSSIPVKVGILLQVYVSRNYQFQSSSLSSDMNYISQNISRVFRCLFQVSLTRTVGVSGLSQRLLEWCKIVERRLWWPEEQGDHHFLRHYTSPPNWFHLNQQSAGSGLKCIKEWVVGKLEERRMSLERIWDSGMSRGELHAVTGNAPDAAKSIDIFLNRIPRVEISHRIIPITPDLVTVELTLHLTNRDWADAWSGMAEPFHVFLDDPDSEDIYFHTQLTVNKRERFEPIVIATTVPLMDPKPNQLTVSIVSDRYVGLEFFDSITVPKSIKLAAMDGSTKPTTLLDLHPLPVESALENPKFQSLFSFSHFNPIQTQVFHQLYHEDVNVLVGAPTGSGKTALAELAMLRVLNDARKRRKIIYIAPMKALSKERIADWQTRIEKGLGKRVEELTGDFTPDSEALQKADVLVTTPEKWDGVSRNWRNRDYVKNVALVIIDEIHLLGQERGAILEVIVSRMRHISSQTKSPVRFIGLSTALANPSEIASWLNVNVFTGLFNFKPSVRPVPMTVHVQGFPEKHYCPRMATMNKPCLQAMKTYSPEKPVIVFVSSRRQTRLTAFDLITYASQDTSHYSSLIGGPGQSPWLKLEPGELDTILSKIDNDALKHTISFGVGTHHAGLTNADRELVEKLFQAGKIQILVATSTVSVGVNLPAHLVVIKGTEFFDPKTKKYKDMPTTDVLQMMGRAGRPQFDTSAVAVVMVHEPKKNFYRKFLYSPFPLESSLHLQLCDHLNAEVASGSVQSLPDALEFLSWTYLFRRVSVNPDFYGVKDINSTNSDILQYLEDLVMTCMRRLETSGCLDIVRPVSVTADMDTLFQPCKLGQIASLYYLKHESAKHIKDSLSKDSGRSIFELAKILADCAEFTDFPMRHKDDVYSGELAEILPFEIDANMKMESPHTKGFLLIVAHMFALPMPIQDFFTDLRSLLDQSVRIIQAMVEIALTQSTAGCLRTIRNLLLLNQCLCVGTNPWCDLTKFMLGRNVKGFSGSFPELVEKIHSERIPGLEGRQVTFLKKLPVARLTANRDYENGKVKVHVTHATNSDPFFQTPLSMVDAQNAGGKRKRIAWWVVVGSEATGQVVAAKRITVSRDSPRTVEFSVPNELEGCKVFLLSDCYFGMDQIVKI
jgi:activating signal cointegrator complex subunit 3